MMTSNTAPMRNCLDPLRQTRIPSAVRSISRAHFTPRDPRWGVLPRVVAPHVKARRTRFTCRAEAQDEESAPKEERALAPAKPVTAYGEMLAYYLKMEPQLFKTAVEDQLKKISDERMAQEAAAEEGQKIEENKDKSELVLYQRMEEVKKREQRATLEDLMYVSVLEKFMVLGVDMLPRIEDDLDVSDMDLTILTEGVHSKEAIELVKEHVLSVMGPAAMAFSNTPLKTSKLQMAQVYAASVMFGYFLRRVDKRFQLEKSIGGLSSNGSDSIPRTQETMDAADRLEKLFRQANNMESVDDPDAAPAFDEGASAPSTADASDDTPPQQPPSSTSTPLRQYVESFDQETMIEMAKIVSLEGAALVERQTTALFGDLKTLQQEMQGAVGPDVLTVEDLLKRIQNAVVEDRVSTLSMTVGSQRRTVLEALAFGTFLRDVETWVQSEYNLLTALPFPKPEDLGPQGPV